MLIEIQSVHAVNHKCSRIKHVDPFMRIEISHSYQMDKSISNLKVLGSNLGFHSIM